MGETPKTALPPQDRAASLMADLFTKNIITYQSRLISLLVVKFTQSLNKSPFSQNYLKDLITLAFLFEM
ncbi:hypothetical protein BJP36_43325 [Moorena producens JHB]|uniref:Uncharacterized protein n=1 Tax=Moorena producens (strain JHB) TaxID=1454205 RepID=A0A9Q9ST65_MOOP1|nr:hypothetical protein [Moorena producens]WAN69195.1 hypothetical protein BJP36_43325 [Moorena producens JHB]